MVRAFLACLTLMVCGAAEANAAVKFRNLTSGDLYYAVGYLDGNLWVSRGYTKVSSGKGFSIPANYYIRIVTSNSASVMTPSGSNSSGNFWTHPINGFTAQEGKSNTSEVYNNGVRTSTTKLTSLGFKSVSYRRYNDGGIYNIGSYWKVATKTYSFSHSTSGDKSENFAYLNNRIIDFSYSISSSRGVQFIDSWYISSDNKKVIRTGPTLQGGPWYDKWSPSYKGSVTLVYIY